MHKTCRKRHQRFENNLHRRAHLEWEFGDEESKQLLSENSVQT